MTETSLSNHCASYTLPCTGARAPKSTPMSTYDNSTEARWGRGKIFSPLHRLVYSWILCAPEWKTREQEVVDVFGSMRRRTAIMKDPSNITLQEIETLANLMGICPGAIRRTARKELNPEMTLDLKNESLNKPEYVSPKFHPSPEPVRA